MSTLPATLASRHVVRMPIRLTVADPRSTSQKTYRRRRLGVVSFLVALVVTVGSATQISLADRGGESASATSVGQANSSYVVRTGDTLWSIAERRYEGADLAAVVDAMVSLNGGAAIREGQTIRLP